MHVQRVDKLSQSCQHRFGRVVFDLIAGMCVGKGVYSVVAHTGSDYADHLLRVYACCCHELGKGFVHQVILQGHLVNIRLDFMVQVLLIVVDRVLVLVETGLFPEVPHGSVHEVEELFLFGQANQTRLEDAALICWHSLHGSLVRG